MSIAPCPPASQAVHGVVVFEPALFKVAFPEFATVDDLRLQAYFDRAELQLNNSCGSRVRNAVLREKLLNLLVAHFAALYSGVSGQPPSGLVGRISEGQEGTVSASVDWGALISPSQAYYLQTPWGAEYWQATARFRQAVYLPAPSNGCGPGFGAGVGIGPTGWGYCGYNGGSS